jgi:hypothetical protein
LLLPIWIRRLSSSTLPLKQSPDPELLNKIRIGLNLIHLALPNAIIIHTRDGGGALRIKVRFTNGIE